MDNDASNVINDKNSEAVKKETERSHINQIEQAINELLADLNNENLAYVLTLMRKYIDTELIVAVKGGDNGLQMAPVVNDGKKYFAMFTNFDEQLKGPTKVQSTYEVSLAKIFDFIMVSTDIEGVIINPWSKPFKVNRALIKVILGK